MINIKIIDPNNIKIAEKSYKEFLIYYIGYATIKYSKYIIFNSVNCVYLIINKVNGNFEEINKNKYLMLFPTNERKKNKKYEKLCSNIKDLIKSMTKTSDDYDERCMKIKFNSEMK